MTTPLNPPGAQQGAAVKLSQQAANLIGIIVTVTICLQLLGISVALIFVREIPPNGVQLLTVILTASTTCLAGIVGWCFAGSAQSSTNADTQNKQAQALSGLADKLQAQAQPNPKPAPGTVAASPGDVVTIVVKPDWLTDEEWAGMASDAQKAAADEWAALDAGGKTVAVAERARWTAEQRAGKVAQYAPTAPAAKPGS